MTLMDFKTKINDNLSLVLESDTNFAFERVLHTWIRALPSDFLDLQMKLNKSNLDDKWTNASTVAQLFILTINEMRNCNIEYNTKLTKQPSGLKLLTIKLVKKAPASDQGQFPEDFPTFHKLLEKVKEMAEANETCETVDSKFQQGYPYPGSCWLCRICPRKDASHKTNSCPLLKNIFSSYLSVGLTCCSTNHINTISNRVQSRSSSRKPSAKTKKGYQ